MTRKICFLALIILYSSLAIGQNYLAGSATLSIEPGNVNFSSALAGYGVPREGRFSITWQKVDQPHKLSALAESGDKIYGIGAGKIFAGTTIGNQVKWQTSSLLKAQITYLCVAGGKFFSLGKGGEILTGTANDKRIIWKAITKSAQAFTALTMFKGKLFAAGQDGNIFSAKVNTTKLQWHKAGNAGEIISLAADDRQLYGVNSHDTLWAIQPRNNYITYQEIGRNNSITSTIHTVQIAIAGKKLYALTPEGEMYVASQNTQNNMAVNALAIKKAKKTVVIVGADVCGFNKSLTDEVKRVIYIKRKIPASAILINASHTHFVPVTQAWTTWGDFYHIPDSAYLNKVVKVNMIKVIEQALDNMQPSNIYIARGQTHIGHNRRPAANSGKPYDTTLDVIKIEGHNKITNVLFSAGCHPVFKNDGAESFTINANFPAVARAIVKSKAGAAHTMFLQGCAGDIDPRSLSYTETGTELANDVLKVLNGPMEKITGEISFSLDSMHIPVTPMSLTQVKAFKDSNLTKTGNVEAEKNVRWADLMINKYVHHTVENYLPEYMQTLNIGQWKYVGLSREAVTQYGLAIRKIWPQKIVSVSGYCNDVPSYLPADWHIAAGVYEGKDSFFWYGQPGIPPLGVLEMVVSKIKANNR